MKIALIGEDILKQPARAVSDSEIISAEFQSLVESMHNTLEQANGIGLAAPQVFDPRAVLIIASRPNSRYPNAPLMTPLVMINPHINATSELAIKDWEGCLSIPGLRGLIARPTWVEVKYLNAQGDKCQQRFEGFVARIFFHEYDHLIGKTWLDHVQSSKDIMANELWATRFG